MSNQNNTPQIPESSEDINEFIYTFLHLTNSDIFQLLHVEITEELINPFQLYGCVRGKVVKDGFLLEEIDLKLVNMVEEEDPEQYKIVGADMSQNTDDPDLIDFKIEIANISKRSKGVDLTYKPSFVLKNGQKIDYHVGNPQTRNGRPCNNMVYF